MKGRSQMTVLEGKYPIINLKNGVHVVNFGSPHSYTFDTGEVLKACSDDVAREMMLDKNHTGVANVIIDTADSRLRVPIPKDCLPNWRAYVLRNHPEYETCTMWLDVFINYQIPSIMEDDIVALAEMDMINIILVPYPVMNAWEYETKVQQEIVSELDDALIGQPIRPLKKFTDVWQFALLKMRTCHLKDRITKIIYSDRFCSSSEVTEAKTDHKVLAVTRNGD